MARDYGLVVIILSITLILIAGGCIRQTPKATNNEKAFSNFLSKVDLTANYSIYEVSSQASSGGGTKSNETRTLGSIELKDTIDEIRDMEIADSFTIGNKDCFYSSGLEPDYFVCFADGKIVNFVKKEGPTYIQWNVVGYEFDIKRSDIINSIRDLKECNADSDCTLTSSGVCDPTGRCPIISAACDPGCRTSINAKQFLMWDFVPLIEDKCITDKCASYDQNEYFEAACVKGVCEPKIVK